MAFTVAVVTPLQGAGGLYAPSAEALIDLAVAEINADGGVGGKLLDTVIIDSGLPVFQVRSELRALVGQGRIQAVSGWHVSTVRQAIAPLLTGRVPYVYPAVYEGGEDRPGIYCTGEVPARQLEPAMRWLHRHRGVRRWFIVGDDYVWPRQTSVLVKGYAADLGLEIAGEAFLSAEAQIGPALDAIGRTGADGVLMLMVGQNAVTFNRQFARRGLPGQAVRLSPLLEENALLATGPGATANLFSTAGYFRALPTAAALDLLGRYQGHQGRIAPPLNSPAESSYEALHLLRELVHRAGSSDVGAIDGSIDGSSFATPRGTVTFEGNQLRQNIYLAEASGVDFSVVAAL
ncbi:substrate-binding domain-containing protein [Pseudarthrobacter sp. NPDC080039]|uniref:substrate-binding domain-containing protein n=1 Tax=unclassified Pseudarthrobacter TaxID=2647000 RepID=UPI003450BA0C